MFTTVFIIGHWKGPQEEKKCGPVLKPYGNCIKGKVSLFKNTFSSVCQNSPHILVVPNKIFAKTLVSLAAPASVNKRGKNIVDHTDHQHANR